MVGWTSDGFQYFLAFGAFVMVIFTFWNFLKIISLDSPPRSIGNTTSLVSVACRGSRCRHIWKFFWRRQGVIWCSSLAHSGANKWKVDADFCNALTAPQIKIRSFILNNVLNLTPRVVLFLFRPEVQHEYVQYFVGLVVNQFLGTSSWEWNPPTKYYVR